MFNYFKVMHSLIFILALVVVLPGWFFVCNPNGNEVLSFLLIILFSSSLLCVFDYYFFNKSIEVGGSIRVALYRSNALYVDIFRFYKNYDLVSSKNYESIVRYLFYFIFCWLTFLWAYNGNLRPFWILWSFFATDSAVFFLVLIVNSQLKERFNKK